MVATPCTSTKESYLDLRVLYGIFHFGGGGVGGCSPRKIFNLPHVKAERVFLTKITMVVGNFRGGGGGRYLGSPPPTHITMWLLQDLIDVHYKDHGHALSMCQ